jgi:hypothetical protein
VGRKRQGGQEYWERKQLCIHFRLGLRNDC